MVGCFMAAPRPPGPLELGFCGLWLIHYLHRTWIYPFRVPNRGRRMALSLVVMALTFNLVNGYLNGRYLSALGPVYPVSWIMDPRFVAGVTLFLLGLGINLHADSILLRLRRPGETGYRIPAGGLFRWISCPNYLGETLEWGGWALATWCVPGLGIAAWTTANLVPRALSHHRWYHDRFPDYPKNRTAILPFIL
jgi:protein-S-isoprenylcysteine O-methyltransferase Ste14